MASDPRAKIGYEAGANPAGRANTLIGDGPLVVETAQWLAQVLPRYHPTVGHNKRSSQRMCEDVFGPSLTPCVHSTPQNPTESMAAVFAVAEAPVSVDTLAMPASFVPRVIVGRLRCRAS